MKENKLVELSMDFSVDIINLVKFLKLNHETIISNQIGFIFFHSYTSYYRYYYIKKSYVCQMMHRLRRYDVFCYTQNDVAPLRSAMMRCLPQCAVRHTSFA